MKLFNNPYRFLFVIGLGLYSYANTRFVDTYRVYGIDIHPLYIICCITLTILLVWEANRITGNLLKKQLAAASYRVHPLLIFFGSSQVLAGIVAVLVYLLFTKFIVKDYDGKQSVALKLILLFSFRINLFLQCVHAIFIFSIIINKRNSKQRS